jgi:hypothetical protein
MRLRELNNFGEQQWNEARNVGKPVWKFLEALEQLLS